jgi:thioredoxin-like negative regulator of GroEL
MIELMLQAEQTLGLGLVDQAERLYAQAAAADPHNAIAVIGLARVQLERGDQAGAHQLALRALSIDPENSMALRMETRLREVLAGLGQVVDGPPDLVAANRRGLVARLLGRGR